MLVFASLTHRCAFRFPTQSKAVCFAALLRASLVGAPGIGVNSLNSCFADGSHSLSGSCPGSHRVRFAHTSLRLSIPDAKQSSLLCCAPPRFACRSAGNRTRAARSQTVYTTIMLRPVNVYIIQYKFPKRQKAPFGALSLWRPNQFPAVLEVFRTCSFCGKWNGRPVPNQGAGTPLCCPEARV